MVETTQRPKIEYVIFDMDGKIQVLSFCNDSSVRSLTVCAYTGLLIDSERVYTDVTSMHTVPAEPDVGTMLIQ